MNLYFLDTSAIVKRYIAKQGHTFLLQITDPAANHDFVISQISLVETVATFCRKVRDQAITQAQRDALIQLFRQDARSFYAVQPTTETLFMNAGDLCKNHKLRAYDAVQLATALAIRADAQANNASLPIFVCADRDLLAVANAEGLITENPNNYP